MTCTVAAVTFQSGPQNLTVVTGEDAYFPCIYSGIGVLPKWSIAGRNYTTRNLPNSHFFNGSGLVVINVNLLMNNWTYFCYFMVLNVSERITFKSSAGTITVISININTTRPGAEKTGRYTSLVNNQSVLHASFIFFSFVSINYTITHCNSQ